MMENHTQSRNSALDIVRIFAFFCVISLHFFLYSGYYSVAIIGKRMFFATLIRTFFRVCVPLFMMLSGYLLKTKKPIKPYYCKLIKILAEYLLASICCIIYHILTDEAAKVSSIILYGVYHIFTYSAAPYGWYVEMYIGLFLLIPFLNILYNNLPNQKIKCGLILTLLFMTAAPGIVNSVRLDWLFPDKGSDAYSYLTLIPQWWTRIYPITYYFIGAYLSEYPLKLRKSVCLLLSVILLLISGSYSYFHSYGTTFVSGAWESNESLFTAMQSVLVFSFINQVSFKCISARLSKWLSYISGLCFSAYLVSYIFDDYFYNTLGWFEQAEKYNLGQFFVIVPLVFACSLVLSAVINVVYRAFTFCFAKQYIHHRSRNAP